MIYQLVYFFRVTRRRKRELVLWWATFFIAVWVLTHSVAVSVLLGLFISLPLVFVHHQLDTSILAVEDIEARLQMPVLAIVPHIEQPPREKGLPHRRDAPTLDPVERLRLCLVTSSRSDSPYANAYRAMRTNLGLEPREGSGRVLLLTSAVAGEGKSATAANLAIGAAQAGISTLLVEGDLRKPVVSKLFGIPREPGFADYFYASVPWEECLLGWEQMENLRILPAGKPPSNPVALFSSEGLAPLLQEMRQRYSLIVMDGSPAMLFADCALLAPHVDGLILVYRWGRTSPESLHQTRQQLLSSKANLLGVVVNDVRKGKALGAYTCDASYDSY